MQIKSIKIVFFIKPEPSHEYQLPYTRFSRPNQYDNLNASD